MRNPITPIIAVVIVVLFMIPTGSDAATRPDNYPTELAELQFWNGMEATVVCVYPDKPIGVSTILPPLPGTATYWVRADTHEVVTSETVFAPGKYLIEAWSWVPEPWGPSPEPEPSEPSTPSQDNTLAIIAIVLSSVAIITSGAVVLMNRRR